MLLTKKCWLNGRKLVYVQKGYSILPGENTQLANRMIRIVIISFPAAFLGTMFSTLYSTYLVDIFAYSEIGYGYPFAFFSLSRSEVASQGMNLTFMPLQGLEDFAFYFAIFFFASLAITIVLRTRIIDSPIT
jgi:hypothetical protein